MTDAAPMIHPLSDVQTDRIGRGTRVWQFNVILPGAEIGENRNINAHCLIEGGVKIGDNVTVKSGVYIWEGTVIEDGALIGPNVTFSNNKYPRANQRPDKHIGAHICREASIGAGAVILPGLRIGQGALVAAGAVVTRDVADHTVVAGVPARVMQKTRR